MVMSLFLVPVTMAVKAYSRLVVGRKLKDIFDNFGEFWKELCSESQLRWVSIDKSDV